MQDATALANTACGYEAGAENSTGTHNTYVGCQSGPGNTTGDYNTFVGDLAGDLSTTGNDNIAIGYNSGNGNMTRQITIGTNITAVSDFTTTLGTDSDGRVYNVYNTNATWTRTSDERWKKDINTNTDCGLDFIKDLRTVTYKWKAPSERPQELCGYNAEVTEPTHKEKMYGFIAQEVKAVLDAKNITDFNGWNIDENDGSQGISYEMFVIPLVKAVQELSAENAELKSLIKNSTSFAKLKSSL